MKNFKKMIVIAGLLIAQKPLIGGAVKPFITDAVEKQRIVVKETVEEAVEKKAREINEKVSQTWAQWLIAKLGLARAEQVAKGIDTASAAAKKEISPAAAKKEAEARKK
jgi:hypothetical protein